MGVEGLDAFAEDGGQEGVAIREVAADRARPDAGEAGDLFQRGAGAVERDLLFGHREQARVVALGVRAHGLHLGDC